MKRSRGLTVKKHHYEGNQAIYSDMCSISVVMTLVVLNALSYKFSCHKNKNNTTDFLNTCISKPYLYSQMTTITPRYHLEVCLKLRILFLEQ